MIHIYLTDKIRLGIDRYGLGVFKKVTKKSIKDELENSDLDEDILKEDFETDGKDTWKVLGYYPPESITSISKLLTWNEVILKDNSDKLVSKNIEDFTVEISKVYDLYSKKIKKPIYEVIELMKSNTEKDETITLLNSEITSLKRKLTRATKGKNGK